MRNKLSRVLAMILAATMTVNTLPMSVFATTPEPPSQNPPVEDEFNDQEDDELDDDDEVVHPEGTIENEDGTFTYPDGTIHDADGNLIEDKKEAFVHPEDAVLNEDGTYTYADGSIHAEDGSVVHPEGAEEIEEDVLLYPDGTYHYAETGELIDVSGIATYDSGIESQANTTYAEGVSVKDGTDYLFFATDRHDDTDIIGRLLSNMISDFGNQQLMDYVGLGGDMVDNTDSYDSGTVLNEVTAVATNMGTSNVDILYASHDKGCTDDANILESESGLWYIGENCYVYGVIETDVKNASSAASAASDFVTWANGLTDDDDKAILVLSHYPLHAERGDNVGAGYWHNALNKVANATLDDEGNVVSVEKDVAFFHGHNHTVDKTEYFYEVGKTMLVESYVNATGLALLAEPVIVSTYDDEIQAYAQANGTEAQIHYTYATAGYLTEERGNGQAMLVAVDNETVTFTKYKSNNETVLSSVTRATEPAEPTIETVSADTTHLSNGELVENGDVITATGLGLSAVSAIWDEDHDLSATFNNEDYTAYDVALEGYTEGENTEISFQIYYGDMTDAVVYLVAKDGTVTEVNATITYTAEDVENDVPEYSTVTFNTTGSSFTVAFGKVDVIVPAGAALTNLEVTTPPTKTKYFVGENTVTDENEERVLPLDITGLVVTATFSNGTETVTKEIPWNEFTDEIEGEDIEVIDGYSLDFDMTVVDNGKGQDVKVSYTYGEVTKETSYKIYIYNKTLTDSATAEDGTVTGTGVSVEMTVPGVTAIKVEDKTSDGTVKSVVAHLLNSFVAYDIELTGHNNPVDENDPGEAVQVTMPLPEGVTNPAVYYVSDDFKTVTKMDATVNSENSTITFTTNHFSTYVVGENTEITVPDIETVEGTGSVTTTVPKEVYVLVDSISAAGDYLVASGNSSTTNLLTSASSGVTNTSGVAVATATSAAGTTITYIESPAAAAIWTASSNNSGYRLQNSSSTNRYLRYNSGLTITSQSNNATTWYSNTNTLYRQGDTRYVRYNSGWTTSQNSQTVYFFQKQTVDFTTTTSVSGVYAIAGDPAQVETAVVTPTADIAATTVDLGYKITFDPNGDETARTLTVEEIAALDGTVTYTVVDGGDPNGIISGISGNVVTFTGKYGKALVKVEFTCESGGTTYTINNYIQITAKAPYYTVDLYSVKWEVATGVTAENVSNYYIFNTTTGFYEQATEYDEDTTYYSNNPEQGELIEHNIALKGVEAGDTYSVWAVIKKFDGTDEEGTNLGDVEDSRLYWTVSNEAIAEIDEHTGILTFSGMEYGVFNVTVHYLDEKGESLCSDTITISVTESLYIVPGDGVEDTFPEYPNNGAVRFDKTATAVGSFSQTGLAKVELSMTGVPYGSKNPIDVTVMLDMSTSMDDDRIAATVAATETFIDTVFRTENKDGTYTYNQNRIYVGYFNGDIVYTITDSENIGGELATIDNDTEYAALIADIKKEYNGSKTDSGTNYDVSLKKCYNVLNTAKTDGTGNDRQQFVVFMSDGGPTDYATSASNVISESTIVGYFNVGTAGAGSNDTGYLAPANYSNTVPNEYWSSLMKSNGVTIYSVGLILQEQPSSGPKTYRNYTDDQYYYITKTLLTGISSGDAYFMNCTSASNTSEMEGIFEKIGNSIKEAATDLVVEDKIGSKYTVNFALPSGVSKDTAGMEDFYIQVVDYTLDSNNERTDTYTVKENFTFKADGTISHTVDGVTCTGCTHVTTKTQTDSDGVVTNIIVTKIDGTYFDYEMKEDGEYLTWTADKLTRNELALQYFVYLDDSAGDIEAADQVEAGTYDTNEYATLTYTDHNGKRVQDEFPIPSQTWKGAKVTYVFYLVNDDGQPVNRAGRVVPFSEAIYVTDPHTEEVTWQNLAGKENFLAEDLFAKANFPEVYKLYDENASYEIRVYQTEGVDYGDSVKNYNYFEIDGSQSNLKSYTTTKVYNTKSGKRYDAYGVYSQQSVGSVLDTTDTNGNATTITTTVKADDINYADTTVAFAVKWVPELTPDTVVVDYGLDALINVIKNDNMAAGVTGVMLTAPSAATYSESVGNESVTSADGLWTASKADTNRVRFHMNKMGINEPATFYYEAKVNYYDIENALQTVHMHSSVTVIPATTIYYEDSFVQFVNGEPSVDTVTHGTWSVDGTEYKPSQAEDRPGESKISADIDADNLYGYDQAYENMATYSMGAAHKVTVSAYNNPSAKYNAANIKEDGTVEGSETGSWPTANFTFTGTGFDLISLTSNTTGMITVDIFNQGTTTRPCKGLIVDTYYGYTYSNGEWEVDPDADTSLYQIPVIKKQGLPYGTYDVVVTVRYGTAYDHQETGSTDFYLDAIRIYDPTGNTNDVANGAYVADGEGWPEYEELRDKIIAAATFDSLGTDDEISGIVFIDNAAADSSTTVSIKDYTNYGPNNELYLSAGQAISFELNESASTADNIHIALKSVGTGAVEYAIYDASATKLADAEKKTVNTATDMYQDITSLNGKTVVIANTGSSGILSITNIKVTHESEPCNCTVKYEAANSECPVCATNIKNCTGTVTVLRLTRNSINLALASLTPVVEETPGDSENSGSTGDSGNTVTPDSGTSSDNTGTYEPDDDNEGDTDDNENSGNTSSDSNKDESSNSSTGSGSNTDSSNTGSTETGSTGSESSDSDTSDSDVPVLDKEETGKDDEKSEETDEEESKEDESTDESDDSDDNSEETETEELSFWEKIIRAVKNFFAGLLA